MCWRFLIIAGGYRIIDMSDRYFLQAHWGEAKVGVYTVYASVARVLQDVLYAGFVATLWPQLVTAYQQRDEPAFEAQRFRMNRVVVRTVLVLVPAFCAGIHGLLWLLDRPALHEEIASYYVLVAATATLSLGTVPNYTLYAAGQDRAILQAVTLGFVSNIVLNAVLIPAGGTLGAAVATLAAICVIVVYQLIVQHRMKRMGVV